MKYQLPELKYNYDALEPHIDELTMRIHHTKHHQGYVNNLNAALEKFPDNPYNDLESLLKNIHKLPESIQTAVRNNGGGHFNHALFFASLKKSEKPLPENELAQAIAKDFGTYERFVAEFANAAKTRFGSGWAWLILNHDHRLEILSTPNQDTPLDRGTPLLGLDVWEHAYYLKYQNRRIEYVDNFFNIIDWSVVSERYNKAR
ncbi:MAG: superoxide dismutase [Bacilli bacterium]|nr:superoxide dismutase [Bacilli bacterium]MBN2696159.1 superoxide dismutase [Bacilli bacterium]